MVENKIIVEKVMNWEIIINREECPYRIHWEECKHHQNKTSICSEENCPIKE